MSNVVPFKRPEKPPIDGANIWVRTLFWTAVYCAGMFGVAFGMGFGLPFLIHECAPPKPFMEKWEPAP